MKRAWIPAVAAVALLIGCDSKPSDKIPTTAPAAAKEPHEILGHLKYIAVRKDYKDVAQLAPKDLKGLYSSAWWFHKHAGEMGISLTAEEIDGLGATEAKNLGYLAAGISSKELIDAQNGKNTGPLPAGIEKLDEKKLDKLPGDKSTNKAEVADYAVLSGAAFPAVYAAGIYRLTKAIPTAMWSEIVNMEIKNNAAPGSKDKDVFLGYKGISVAQVTVRPNADGTLGVIYVYFKVTPKKLAAMATEVAK
jgi:hypothetical protein